MMDEKRDQERAEAAAREFSRREFVAMSIAAGIAASAGSASGAELPVTVTNVDVKTADGTCNAAFVYPTTGAHAGVIIWADAFGLRPALVAMGRRLAAEGYSVLVPNPYYRVTRDPGIDTSNFNFSTPADRAKLNPLMGSIQAAGAAEKDAEAFVAFLDAQPQVAKARKIGTQGYCMGGALVMRTAAAVPTRIGAAGSFHGGGLVTDAPTSPHLLAPKIKARVYVAIAANDDQRQPDAKDKLREAFSAASVPAEIEVYPAQHGWCMTDMPAPANAPIYNRPEAEKAWTKLVALYKAALV